MTYRAAAASTVLILALTLLSSSGCRRHGPQRDRSKDALNKYVEGMIAYRAGQRDEAIASMLEAVRANQRLTMARVVLADIYQNNNQHEEAVKHLEVLVQLDPYTFANHYNLGFSYQILQRFQESAASYLRALELKPTDAQANMNLGKVYMALGQPEDALKYARAAATVAPDSAEAHVALARVLEAQGKFDEAEKAYRRALEIKSDTGVMLSLGGNLINQKKSGEAISVLVQLIRQEDSAAARKRLADALVLRKNFDGAMNEYNAALKLDPGYYPALNEMGLVLIADYKQGLELDDSKRQRAMEAWRKSMQINPAQPAIATLLQQWEKKPLFMD